MELFQERDGIRLSARLLFLGHDLCAAVSGGDCPHIGSVCLGVPRPSLADSGSVSSTVNTLNLTGHKDDWVANRFAAALSQRLGRPVAVICGIHVNQITADQLRLTQELALALLEDCLRAVAPD